MRHFDLLCAASRARMKKKAIALAAVPPRRVAKPLLPPHPQTSLLRPISTLNGPQRELIPICAAFTIALPFFLSSPFSCEEVEFVPDFTSESTFALYFRARYAVAMSVHHFLPPPGNLDFLPSCPVCFRRRSLMS